MTTVKKKLIVLSYKKYAEYNYSTLSAGVYIAFSQIRGIAPLIMINYSDTLINWLTKIC